MVYYNENNPFCVQWLRNLIEAGHIARGVVDDRSIMDVRASDLSGYTQCHFFAGVGVWSYALRQAGWPDEREVWTGSCPCQPFSQAGKRKGFDDERHLWPVWFALVDERRPVAVFGEQVASKDGLSWLDIVQVDLERAGYAVGALDTCAAGFGAPHIRQRLYFVADADGRNSCAEGLQRSGEHGQQPQDGGADSGGVAYPESQHDRSGESGTRRGTESTDRRADGGVGDSNDARSQGRRLHGTIEGGNGSSGRSVGAPSAVNGFWRDAHWLPCIDGKARPVEPGTFPLAHGVPARVGRLRGYGNAIVPQVAEEVIRAYLATSMQPAVIPESA